LGVARDGGGIFEAFEEIAHRRLMRNDTTSHKRHTSRVVKPGCRAAVREPCFLLQQSPRLRRLAADLGGDNSATARSARLDTALELVRDILQARQAGGGDRSPAALQPLG